MKIKETGRAGRALRSYKIGDTLSIEGVYGKFILKENEYPKVYIATGTGLAPIYHMLESSTYPGESLLFFSVPTKEDVFYISELSKIERLKVHIFLTREAECPASSANIEYHTGRMSLQEYQFSGETNFYICGAPAMVEDTQKYLAEHNFRHVFSETFTS